MYPSQSIAACLLALFRSFAVGSDRQFFKRWMPLKYRKPHVMSCLASAEVHGVFVRQRQLVKFVASQTLRQWTVLLYERPTSETEEAPSLGDGRDLL